MGNNLESLRKLLVTGIGAVLMSEEGILKLLSELKLPSDAKNYLLAQAQKKKKDISRVIGAEIKSFLEHLNIHEEIRKSLVGLTLDVDATLQIRPGGPELRTAKTRITRKKTVALTERRR